jgi:diadenosine tetraphosphate (Ap4A) HIT family hydrolase
MGTRPAHVKVFCNLSDHNSEQDDLDEAALARLVAEITRIADKPEYADIVLWVESVS